MADGESVEGAVNWFNTQKGYGAAPRRRLPGLGFPVAGAGACVRAARC